MIRYTKKEEIWNAASHGGGVLLGVVFGIIFLIWCFQADNNWARIGVILYLFGMLGSYAASTIYHSIKHHSKWKERLRKWDHAAIYWHIAGSYSPLTLVALREQGYWGVEPFLLCVGLCYRWNHYQFYPSKRAFQRRNVLFRRYGPECSGGLQTFDRFSINSSCCLDYCRGRELHHWCRFLFFE